MVLRVAVGRVLGPPGAARGFRRAAAGRRVAVTVLLLLRVGRRATTAGPGLLGDGFVTGHGGEGGDGLGSGLVGDGYRLGMEPVAGAVAIRLRNHPNASTAMLNGSLNRWMVLVSPTTWTEVVFGTRPPG